MCLLKTRVIKNRYVNYPKYSQIIANANHTEKFISRNGPKILGNSF